MSGQFKGTPGPWIVDPSDRHWGRHIYTDTDTGNPSLPIASLNMHRNWEANAHLIAAAPELLEALLLQEKASNLSEAGDDVQAMLVFAQANDKRRAALSKALGESS